MSHTFFKKFCIGILAAVFLAGCSDVTEEEVNNAMSGDSTDDTIKIGVLFPVSGEAAVYGEPGVAVLKIAQDEINAAGGVNGKKIALEIEDGACDPNQANKAINNLVSVKNVKVIVGGFCSSETLTAAPVVEAEKVVLLSPGSSSPKITTAGDYIFRNYPSDNAQGEALADYVAKKGIKKVGLIVEEQPYTEGIADTFTEAFKKAGGDVMIEKYAADASDFRTQITKLQGGKVEMYFVDPQTPAKGDIIVKQLQEAGIKGPLILNDVAIGALQEVVSKHKEYLEGSIGAEVPYDKANPGVQKLQDAYKKQTGKTLQYLSYMTTTYDSLYIIKEALEKVGEDGPKIKDYLYTVAGRKGLAGTLSFDKNGDPTADFRHALRMVKGGAVEDYKEEAAMTK